MIKLYEQIEETLYALSLVNETLGKQYKRFQEDETSFDPIEFCTVLIAVPNLAYEAIDIIGNYAEELTNIVDGE